MQNKGQVTLFIIIAIVVVAAIAFSIFYFTTRGTYAPSEAQAVESYFHDCIDATVKEASRIAGLQAGWINMPEFESGSEHFPFSSRLSFLGLEVPYWFYVSGNGLSREQRPSLSQIEQGIEDFVALEIQECDLYSVGGGYEIEISGEPSVEVQISQSSILTKVDWPIQVTFGDSSSVVSTREVRTASNLGKLYDTASAIFDTQQQDLFLENYALDVLRLYSPVTGIEITCAPRIWKVDSVKRKLQEALEANIATIKAKGSYYDLRTREQNYFVVDMGKRVDETVYFLYNPDMPSRIEVWPTEDGIMKAEPIGNQPGLGILSSIGFCYVPYHFVYDVNFPVLVQLIDGEDVFQFPVLVIIDNNQARNATSAEAPEAVFDICEHKLQKATVVTYDENSNALEADVFFKCFNQVCDIGETKIREGKASLIAELPQCYNGYLITRAQGYRDSKIMVTSTSSFAINVFMNPRHVLDLQVQGIGSGEYASVTFTSEDYSASVYYPEQNQIELSEGIYDVSVSLFKDSTITLQSQSVEKCIRVPDAGISGMFGGMHEECFDLELPRESLTSVVFGGGKSEFSVTESELSGASRVTIVASEFDVPRDIFELGDIYDLIEMSELSITVS